MAIAKKSFCIRTILAMGLESNLRVDGLFCARRVSLKAMFAEDWWERGAAFVEHKKIDLFSRFMTLPVGGLSFPNYLLLN